ncbi:amidase [Comamonas sp. Z1]|uniref:Amidase family protein n=1 Tax=Comamonas thiooxydans TaxID=363952 RepID=A0A5M3M288_9BURK|nr:MULTISPECIES: amidase family protein [Comamonas]EFI62511.1 amidase [Comamonas thiooxydans]KKI12380.1 amidase [Comamonas thiooxydans]MDH1337371.1 amidase family protein [Comamonas thiooxydans]MDH1743497.1 amidase family protein [Comamonas thiooxydans]MDH1789837.1 amidase family protein [Comamonas thiooxydans]
MELWQMDAAELAARIARCEVSCVESVESCLDRISKVNPLLNAIVDADDAQALEEARAADVRLARGEALGPLHGVPVTIKVNADQRGFATTNGIPANRDLVADADSAVVANLRRAGAIPIGRTNTPAFSMRWFTDNDLHGRTLNPHNADLTPGGSSGGAAVAVAAGMGPIAHGNDVGGSIRYPAYACGVYGLRPTVGRVPAFNPASTVERPISFFLNSVQGPLARSVADIRLALQAMSTRDVRDPQWVPVAPAGVGISAPCRVALCLEAPGYRAAPAVEQALRRAAQMLADAGYDVVEAAPPRLREAADAWLQLTTHEVDEMLGDAVATSGDSAVQLAHAAMHALVPGLGMKDYLRMQGLRVALQREWAVFLQRYPLLLCPVSWQTPFAVDGDLKGAEVMRTLVDAQSMLLSTAILALPGLTVPMGLAPTGPTGVQLVAGRFEEERCLGAAEQIERRRGPVAVSRWQQ